MDKKIITKVALVLLLTVSNCWAGGCKESLAAQQPEKVKPDPVEAVLKQLNQNTAKIKSYEGRIEYRISQPLFESETLRKGVLYYARFDKKKTKLRINFQTLKQDDEKEQKYIEQFIFDGVWLTHLDYQIKTVRCHQLAEPNKPVDAFELASKNLPIIGFAKIKDLKKQFEIKLIELQGDEQEKFIHLHLKVKPDSVYKDKYVSIDFWIDKKLYLPAKIVAVSTEPADVPFIKKDSYQIKLLKPKVNKKLDKKVFDFKIPRGFGKPEIIPLKKKDKQKIKENKQEVDAFKLVPLDIKLPKPMFIGAGSQKIPPNTDLSRGPRPPFMVPVGTRNVALGKRVTSSADNPIIGQLEMITDGNKEGTKDYFVELAPGLQSVTIDLEDEFNIYAIIVWHWYWYWLRIDYDVIVQIANDPEFTNVELLFNNDHDNSAGLGIGGDQHYIETHEGKLVDAKGKRARYVRLYSNGSTVNEFNHYVEVEVFGKFVK